MFRFAILNRALEFSSQLFKLNENEGDRKRKLTVFVAIAMLFVVTGATLATVATTIANSEASSTTIAWRPRPVPPNREGSDEP